MGDALLIPAISLWQPWASFIAIGVKPYETRHWQPPDKYIGRRIAIHAAKRPVARYDIVWWHEIAGADAPLFKGAFVCTALLESVHRTETVTEDDYGDYSPGRFAWRLTEVQVIDPPIPAIGRQGFWLWDRSVKAPHE